MFAIVSGITQILKIWIAITTSKNLGKNTGIMCGDKTIVEIQLIMANTSVHSFTFLVGILLASCVRVYLKTKEGTI